MRSLLLQSLEVQEDHGSDISATLGRQHQDELVVFDRRAHPDPRAWIEDRLGGPLAAFGEMAAAPEAPKVDDPDLDGAEPVEAPEVARADLDLVEPEPVVVLRGRLDAEPVTVHGLHGQTVSVSAAFVAGAWPVPASGVARVAAEAGAFVALEIGRGPMRAHPPAWPRRSFACSACSQARPLPWALVPQPLEPRPWA